MKKNPGSPIALVSASLFFLATGVSVFAADDAQYIKCVIPDSLITDQVFQASISMKNTGTTTWGSQNGETPVTLVSQNPKCTMTWGTYFIILGQGNSVAPGDTFAFTSRLKAPGTPGTYNFVWQIQRWISSSGVDTTAAFFGGTVSGRSIRVKQRTQTPPPPPAHRDSLLDSSDFEYAGSFMVPNLPGEEDKYTESGLALRNVNGAQHLFVRTGTYDYKLYEMTIPALVKIASGNYSSVHTGTVVCNWGDLGYGTVGGEAINSNCGFWFEDTSGILFWSHYNGYYTGGPGDFPQLMATRLNADGTKTNVKYWNIPAAPARYKSYWGGPLKLSKNFAAAYTGGRELGVGFGGYYSICGSASRGPALGAIARPNMSAATLDLLEMMTYADPAASPRDGNYFAANVGFWNDDPASPWKGTWTYDDYCRAGVFIDLPDKRGYLAFVSQVTGRVGYDYGGYNTDGHSQQCWYFYDLKDLGAAAQGRMSPDSIKPSSYVKVCYPIDGSLVTGACFDSASRMAYVYVQFSQDDGEPIIHAYHVKEGNAAVERTAASLKIAPEFLLRSDPAHRTIRISLDAAQIAGGENAIVAIFDPAGKLIRKLPADNRRLSAGITVDASAMPEGAYIAEVRSGDRHFAKEVLLSN